MLPHLSPGWVGPSLGRFSRKGRQQNVYTSNINKYVRRNLVLEYVSKIMYVKIYVQFRFQK